MKNLKLAIGITALFAILVGASVQASWWPFSDNNENKASADLLEVAWDDLIPADFVQPENPFSTMSQEAIDILLDGSEESNAELARLEKEFYYAPVNEELDGKRVKIAAYITPLDFDGQTKMSEFLLVPYVGACMHTPPPPANQVVHAESAETIEMQSIYDPVWAIGTIHAETVQSDLAESGYRLTVEKVLPYTSDDKN